MKPKKLLSLGAFFLYTLLNSACFSQSRFPYDQLTGPRLLWADSLPCSPEDTIVIMVTVREKAEDSSKLFSDETILSKHFTTLLALWKSPCWYLKEVPSLEEALQLSGYSKEIVTYVHGDGKDFPLALNRAADIRLLFDVPVIAFDVPSLLPQSGRIKNFYNSKRNFKKSAPHFSEYIQTLSNIKEKQAGLTLTLHMHSLGNTVYMECLKENRLDSYPVLFETLLMNAAAVKQKRHKRWLEKSTIQKCIYITYNKKDHTLNGAHLITLRKQLGERVKKPLAGNSYYINVHPLAGKEHNYYSNVRLFSRFPNLQQFYMDILHGRDVPLEDEHRFTRRKDGKGFDIR
jgi:hypothetical protein